ncbi:hypothetical protein [Algivirga pacifica]|uniref:Uncharacterized protein n=1 Tax=Algivirga pacifica TaxID=1162670 RepID=A0ABP9DEK8_9BACT
MSESLYFSIEGKELFTLVIIFSLYFFFGRRVLKGSIEGINHMFNSMITPKGYSTIVKKKSL